MGTRNVHNLDIGQIPSDSLYGYGPESSHIFLLARRGWLQPGPPPRGVHPPLSRHRWQGPARGRLRPSRRRAPRRAASSAAKVPRSRPNRPANRARRTQSRVSNVQRPRAVISIGYVPPRIGGEPTRIPRFIQFPSRSLASASSRFGRTFLASFPQLQYIPT